MPEFTVLIPTHDHADTLFHSVASVQRQTLQDFEILVVGDGAPPRTAEVMAQLMAGDTRIRYFPNPKGERHGERHRHAALGEARGALVAYLSDDDLWAPEHLETVRDALKDHDLVHTMHLDVLPDGSLYSRHFDARLPADLARMRRSETGFGLATGAHTMVSYRKLPHGWNPAPPRTNTDIHFWLQFLDQPWCRYNSIARLTLFHFASPRRQGWSMERRVDELSRWSRKLENDAGRAEVVRTALHQVVVSEHQTALKATRPGRATAVAPSQRVRFSEGAPGCAYLLDGFSRPAKWGCWTEGNAAALYLPLREDLPSLRDLRLHLRLQMFVHPPGKSIAKCSVRINGRQALSLSETQQVPKNYEIALRADDFEESRALFVQFRIEDPRSPADFGLSKDPRALGVGLVDCMVSGTARGGEPRITTPLPKLPRQELVRKVGRLSWFHSIDFGNGIVAPGQTPLEYLKAKADICFRGGVAGRSVLDVGCWDGYYSFEAKRRGAARVVATDQFVWSRGHREAFELARSQLAPDLEAIDIDVHDINESSLGRFDIVLFLGVFYHLRNPFLALESLAKVCKETMVVETQLDAMELPRPAMIFYPGRELADDPTNWWGPNVSCVQAMLHDLGFECEVIRNPVHADRGVFIGRRPRAP